MEYLEGLYYSESKSKKVTVIRFYKNGIKLTLKGSLSDGVKDIPKINEWFNLDAPNMSTDTYAIKDKKIFFNIDAPHHNSKYFAEILDNGQIFFEEDSQGYYFGNYYDALYNKYNEGDILKSNKSKIREVLTHEVMTKGSFSFESEDGSDICVAGQKHTLWNITQLWNEESEEWEEDDREEFDEFYLTHYEDGVRYDESDLRKFFKIAEENFYAEWNWNGFSENWCGIDERDDKGTRDKKWEDYKNKFPLISSKEQFRLHL